MQTFDYEQNGVKYRECYFDVKPNMDNTLEIQMYGHVEDDKNVSHIFNVTVGTSAKLPTHCVAVDNYSNSRLVDFLIKLGVIKQIVSRIVIKLVLFPIVELNLETLRKYTYNYDDLLCAKGA